MATSGAIAYGVHYASAKMYNFVCVPDGVLGFVQGMFTNGSPWCNAGLTIMTHTQNVYSTVLLVSLTRAVVGYITGS
jgi:hypothetical protein